ncbi:GATA zinc finger domain-containing protein 15 isoform X2 [Octopus bimaculoides]|nr:GATA zinc finger domain-containing protein 15 isoform X2 [Octopus bimaculoides]XP_014790748.1 GATA zinc finger domain-containing protein 15 isoform X2 [Octopus bimaculoides]XP_014790749.1 GATA zinc finger domain-containing protein 15 isoform X2 [Octopus bimaculoides]|eukprot:XP_014790747.1 PREDICTED: GATA zinc finger domain-containing protein 15-like isoform X2 [Octopus bimaculoides]
MPSLWHRLITGRHRYKRAASRNQRKNNLIKTYADDGDDYHHSAMFYSLANLWCENDLSPSKNYFDIDAYRRMQFASAQNVSGSNNPLIYGNNYQDLHSKYKNGVLNNAIHSRRLSSTNSDERGKSSSTLLRNKNKKNNKKSSKMSFLEKISNRKDKRAYDNPKCLMAPANSAAASELRMASNVCVNYVSAYNNKNTNSRNYGDDVSSGYGGIGRGGGTHTTNINEYVPKSFRHLATSLALRGHQVIRDKFDITDFNHINNQNNNKNVDNYLYHDGGSDFQHRIICTKLQEPTENIISGQFVLAKRNHFYNNVNISSSSSSGNSSSGEEPMSTSFGSSSISQAWNWEAKDEGHQHDQQQMSGRNARNVTMEDDLGFVDSRDSDEEWRQEILSTSTTTNSNNNNKTSNITLTAGNGKAGEDQGRLSDNGSLVELQRQQITRKLSIANYVTDSDDCSNHNNNNRNNNNNNNNCGKRRNELDNLDKIIRNNNNNNNNNNGNTNTEIQIVISTVSETGNEIDNVFLY